ncbi:MAG: IS1096 element passenger TnpR family protein [Chloroflexota bacterium]|nr:hypothetical protein [Lentimicrobium sp.]
MHLYRFRLLSDEQEDFLRDYDIFASQTFFDLHKLIVETVELKGNELASFFICDRNWRKKKEITLIDMQPTDEDQHFDDDDDDGKSARTNKIPTMEMAKVKIKEVIDDPHQRLLYEYDFLNPKTFFIELTKIINADNIEGYPKCVKSVGKIIPTAISSLPFISDEALEEEIPLPGEFDEITQNDDDDDIIIDSPPDLDKEW